MLFLRLQFRYTQLTHSQSCPIIAKRSANALSAVLAAGLCVGIQSEQKTLAEHLARGYDDRVVRRQTDAERIDEKKGSVREICG